MSPIDEDLGLSGVLVLVTIDFYFVDTRFTWFDKYDPNRLTQVSCNNLPWSVKFHAMFMTNPTSFLQAMSASKILGKLACPPGQPPTFYAA